MCAAVWVGQGQSLSEETVSFLGTPDSFPSEPPEYCGDSLPSTGNDINDKIAVSLTVVKWQTQATLASVWPSVKSLELYFNWIC